jgi:hypothetical protein
MKKIIFIVFVVVFGFFFVGFSPEKEVSWGVNFSQKHAQDLGLDWKETYTALLQDLQVKRLKVAVHWDLIEQEQDQFSFQDIDWQVQQAEKVGAKLMLVVGMKTPRWPECHIPFFAQDISQEQQQQEILQMVRAVVNRYKDSPALERWQIENEPLVPFGTCPWADETFFEQELALVKELDSKHPILVADSGELALWLGTGKHGDILGTTLYRKVWASFFHSYFTYPYPPVFYARKALLVKLLYGKETIGVELQAEPWGPGKLIYDTSLQEQAKTMNKERFQGVVEYARRVGFTEQYFWGAEWWYYMKEIHNNDDIWQEAKNLFDT